MVIGVGHTSIQHHKVKAVHFRKGLDNPAADEPFLLRDAHPVLFGLIVLCVFQKHDLILQKIQFQVYFCLGIGCCGILE